MSGATRLSSATTSFTIGANASKVNQADKNSTIAVVDGNLFDKIIILNRFFFRLFRYKY